MGDTEKKVHSSVDSVGFAIGQRLMDYYWHPMWKLLEAQPELYATFTAFLLQPEKLVFYIGRTHLAVEYVGPARTDDLARENAVKVQIFDYMNEGDLLSHILGIQFDSTHRFKLSLVGASENWVVPSNAAFDILQANGWNFAGQSMALLMNSGGFDLRPGEFARLVNSFFYGADEHGLVTRHIQWMEFLPLEVKNLDEDTEALHVHLWPDINRLINHDAKYIYPLPDEFQTEKLFRLNRFVELFSASRVREIDITHFLAQPENQFILKMAFFGRDLAAEVTCEWADGGRAAIRPDFLVVQPSGFADIVEFKLPTLRGEPVVGRENRESFSAEVQQYVSQTRVYREYFDDPRNRRHVQDRYGLAVNRPKRWLVLGRRWMFSTDEWREIEADFRDFGIRTYDDLVDGVLAQLYS